MHGWEMPAKLWCPHPSPQPAWSSFTPQQRPPMLPCLRWGPSVRRQGLKGSPGSCQPHVLAQRRVHARPGLAHVLWAPGCLGRPWHGSARLHLSPVGGRAIAGCLLPPSGDGLLLHPQTGTDPGCHSRSRVKAPSLHGDQRAAEDMRGGHGLGPGLRTLQQWVARGLAMEEVECLHTCSYVQADTRTRSR